MIRETITTTIRESSGTERRRRGKKKCRNATRESDDREDESENGRKLRTTKCEKVRKRSERKRLIPQQKIHEFL